MQWHSRRMLPLALALRTGMIVLVRQRTDVAFELVMKTYSVIAVVKLMTVDMMFSHVASG
jgi:hypothetical protein